jgi:predicted TIM-barrel fold metal-dependent hydrolase
VGKGAGHSEAKTIFAKYRFGGAGDGEAAALGLWLLHEVLEEAGRQHLPVSIHCGIIWNCWNDFRRTNPLNIIPLLIQHRNTAFDLYHGGIPWVREMGVIGNQYPNANLDLVWCHQISAYMTEHMLNEWIDLVPINKIIGFAGDNPCGPEKTYGALVMTRENIARALAVRISRGQMTESRAVDICRMWLYENPKRIYGL